MENLAKQDSSFLESPLWMQDERAEPGLTWTDKAGFVYQTSCKPPVKTDMIFLYYILLQSQEREWSELLEFSQYEILKGCGIQPGKSWRERLRESLRRWSSILIEFEGTSSNGQTHLPMCFHIIDSWKIREEDNKLLIELSKDWLVRVKESNFFKCLDFEQVKKLRSPLALRLYEILIKSLQSHPNWSCEAKKLAAKIPMNEQYPANIIPKIKAAVNRINEKTELQIKLTIQRPKRGKAIFEFEKLESQPKSPKTKPQIVDVPPEQAESFKELLDLLPPKEQGKKTLRDLLARKLRKEGPDFVRRNILYANKNANTNYRVYLTKALKEDWGEAYE